MIEISAMETQCELKKQKTTKKELGLTASKCLVEKHTLLAESIFYCQIKKKRIQHALSSLASSDGDYLPLQ